MKVTVTKMRLYNIDELAELLFSLNITNVKMLNNDDELYINSEDRIMLINTLNKYKIINVNVSFHNNKTLKLTLS